MANVAVGDLVIRKSHGGDIVFKVTNIYEDNTGQSHCTLKGMHLRLVADAPLSDLERVGAEHLRNEILHMESVHNDTLKRVLMRRSMEREKVNNIRAEHAKKYEYFELPGRVLHLDGDEEYLAMCLKTYNQMNIDAVGRCIEESKQPEHVIALVDEYRPDILILTGHDALLGGGKKDFKDINNYRNSRYFIESVKKARIFEPSKDDLVIFAGACQSYFEAILIAGANFASAPTRIFIHAYDPVFIAEKVAFTPINRTVDIGDAITASVTGADGVGGIETRGKFRLGLPKTPY
ncbi:spore coat assemly protein [Pelosinus fermentans]|uniref:sporulation peptidase YabG n=1 Tax=Pelosinus fermentans TaxID=365349 RepID=UPI000268536F|nr:sporulation peptidase YabG [Pelosinus fermentans]OAM92623.1 sporulation peptidase YabG [Pelosinus fermentans DSM 17108]SDQ51276.1 spore coat assemly protein [Pelosinus fermentans]